MKNIKRINHSREAFINQTVCANVVKIDPKMQELRFCDSNVFFFILISNSSCLPSIGRGYTPDGKEPLVPKPSEIQKVSYIFIENNGCYKFMKF